MPKRVKVTNENKSGRNTNFYDNFSNKDMTRGQFVKEINSGNYPNYHTREINGVKTPVSNPDKTKNNNLD
jgi:hypothetical protein